VVPTRHKISVQKPLNPLAEVFSPIGSTTSESILEMSNHSRSLEVSNDTDDIVSGHATDASRSSNRNDDSLGIHQHNDRWSEVTNENEVSGEVDTQIDGIQNPIEQTRETVVRRTGRHAQKPDRYGDYIYF